MSNTRKVCLLTGCLAIVSQIPLLLTLNGSNTLRMLETNEQIMDMMILAERPNSFDAMEESSLSSSSLVKGDHEDTTSNPSVKEQQHPSAKQRLLVHLHIGKNGGTSLDGLLSKIVRRDLNHKYLYNGFRHFDWSYVEKLQQQYENEVEVVTMLQSPVERAYSHFRSAQVWMTELRVHNLTLQEYLNDKNLLMQTRSIWFDGQAGVSWLTGTHTEEWVVGNLNETERLRREVLYETNKTALLLQAADRLDQTLWFGILQDLPRSMELLQHALNLTETPTLPRGNANPNGAKPEMTPWQQDALASLMPMDMWLYDYSKRLLEARYMAMKSGVLRKPERPPLPTLWSCVSNRTALECVDGPFKGLLYTFKP